jgi:hypothetical protein
MNHPAQTAPRSRRPHLLPERSHVWERDKDEARLTSEQAMEAFKLLGTPAKPAPEK